MSENQYLKLKCTSIDSIRVERDKKLSELIYIYENRTNELINKNHSLSIENSKLIERGKRKNKRFWGSVSASVAIGLILGIIIAK